MMRSLGRLAKSVNKMVFGLALLVAVIVEAQAEQKLYFVHSDHLGTPQLLTDENQTVVWKAEYTPFGEAVVDEDPDGNGVNIEFNLRFPGQYYDKETGTAYNIYRTYSSREGRYIQSDPIGLAGGINTYTYAGGNPIIYTDPFGLAYSPMGEHGNDYDGNPIPERKERIACENKCIQMHYFGGSTYSVARGVNVAGALPVPKGAVGMPVLGTASPATNAISAAGHTVTGPNRGKIGRQVLGTNRWAGLAGRLNLALFVGMTAYDIVTIQICIEECMGDDCPKPTSE